MIKIILFLVFLINILFNQIIEKHFKFALKLKSEKQYEKSLLELRNIIHNDSSFSPAYKEAIFLLTGIGFLSEDDEIMTSYYTKAYSYARKLVQIDSVSDKSYVALAVAIGRMTQIVDTKGQLLLTNQFKEAAERAIIINPNNDLAYHIIAKWNFRLADLSWFEKTYIKIAFGKLPVEAKYENAIKFYLKAIELNPQSIAHKVELAKVYLELDELHQAKFYLKEAVKFKSIDILDNYYLTEAYKLLEDKF